MNRPDPEALLAEIKKEEKTKGNLKIFLGYAPGVGKTYSMLEEAISLQKKGKNILVGVVETHKRYETEKLLEGLKIIPRKEILYKNIQLYEMDLEKIIELKPDLVLVDELAHSNPPDSKHPKRYQDIEDILDNNIDVYTTVNIQHFESVNDIISEITGIKVSETLPDLFLDKANEIEIIDIPIEELHERLNEGKVYIPEQASRALENFFSRHNLTALRELALRRVANKLDNEIVNHMKAKAINKMWATSERLLVSVAPSPYADFLIRRTYQMADELNAEWFALYVEVTPRKSLSLKDKTFLTEALTLAEDLGAKIRMSTGTDTASEIVNLVNQEKITKVVLGKPRGNFFNWIIRRSPAYKILDESNNFDIYFVNPQTKVNDVKDSKIDNRNLKINYANYLYSILTTIPVFIIGLFFYHILNIKSFETFFILSPITTAMFWGTYPSLFISIINILIYDFFFVDPLYTFTIARIEYVFDLIIFFITSIIIGQLTKLINHQKEVLKIKLEELQLLEELNRELLKLSIEQSSLNKTNIELLNELIVKNNFFEKLSNIISKYIIKSTNIRHIILFNNKNHLNIYYKNSPELRFNSKDYAIATWVFNNKKEAGSGTKTLTSSDYFFLPIIKENKSYGVISFLGNYSQLLPNEKYIIKQIIRNLSNYMYN
ncbi:MAG: DUF4118 domain-containing protein [Candidatus Sericytochromatia bacterium]